VLSNRDGCIFIAFIVSLARLAILAVNPDACVLGGHRVKLLAAQRVIIFLFSLSLTHFATPRRIPPTLEGVVIIYTKSFHLITPNPNSVKSTTDATQATLMAYATTLESVL
jgi:hypothetical protein